MRYHDLDLWLERRDGAAFVRAHCAANHGTRESAWSVDTATVHGAVEAGTGLPFAQTFPVDVYAQLRQCIGTTLDHERRGLRVRLFIEDAALAAMPWEYLRVDDGYLAAAVRTPLVRCLPLPEPARPLTTRPPLRLLAAIPAHTGLDTDTERRYLETATAGLGDLVQLDVLDGRVTRQRLEDALLTGSYHGFHFIGHGDHDGDRAVLLINDADGAADAVDHDWLGRLFANHDTMKLVVLNACRGASVSAVRPLAGLAHQLVRHEIPAVVAMQDEILDDEALHFCRAFYTSLFRGADRGRVDIAVSHARNALLREGGARAVGIPVLFLRDVDGVLFHIVTGAGLPETPLGGAARDTADATLATAAAVVDAARAGARDDLAAREATALDALRRRVRLRDASFGVAGAAALIAFFALWLGVFEWLPKWLKPEHYAAWLGDAFVTHALHDAIVPVTIDTATVRVIGRGFDPGPGLDPSWRIEHARLIDGAAAAGARVVALDFAMRAPSDHDTALVRAIAAASERGTRVVVAAYQRDAAGRPGLVPALLEAGAAWGSACMGLPGHAPNVVPLLAVGNGGATPVQVPALALAAVAAFAGGATIVTDAEAGRLSLVAAAGGHVRPVPVSRVDSVRVEQAWCTAIRRGDRLYEAILPYVPTDTLRARRVAYEAVARGTVAGDVLAGRILLVGNEAGGDAFPVLRGLRREVRAGVHLHADALSALLHGTGYRYAGGAAQFGLILAMALTGALVALGLDGRPRRLNGAALAAALGAYLAIAVNLYVAHGLLLNALYHTMALLVAWRAVRGLRRRYFP